METKGAAALLGLANFANLLGRCVIGAQGEDVPGL